jgi:hypothetical protein
VHPRSKAAPKPAAKAKTKPAPKKPKTAARGVARRDDNMAGQTQSFREGRAAIFSRESSEIGHDRLRYGQSGRARKEGVRILGADHLRQWAFRCARHAQGAPWESHLPISAMDCRMRRWYVGPIHVQFLLWWGWVS